MANWLQIVPSPTGTPPSKSAIIPTRFFVDPYNSNVVYIIDQTAIKRSDDGGATWNVDTSLDAGLDFLPEGKEVALDPADRYLANPRSTVVLLAR